MKPLRIAWNQRVRRDESDVHDISSDSQLVMPWRGHAVVPHVAGLGAKDIGVVVDRDGNVVRTLDAPRPYDRPRYPFGIATAWPDEGIAIGVQSAWNESDTIELLWVDLGGASMLDSHLRDKPRTRMRKTILPTTDGGMLFSTAITNVELGDVGWPAELPLADHYETYRRSPFDDHVYTTDCIDPAKPRWHASGRAACVADDVVVLEEGAAMSKQIVARRASDGGELWRQPARDRFVLGTVPIPAWSDDRLYIYDRGDRRQRSWEREAMLVRQYPVDLQRPLEAYTQTVARARQRREHPITGASRLACASARLGTLHWETELPGDIVSFLTHPAWVACVVAGRSSGAIHVWRHDGAPIAAGTIASPEEHDATWPPDASQWPCIAHGDEEHLVLAQNRGRRRGGPRVYAVRLDAPDAMVWEVRVEDSTVLAPYKQTLRLLNRAPIAFAGDAAYLRFPKLLLGLRA